MYNLLEYIQNYSVKLGSLWNYYRGDIDDVDDNASDGKSFIYKTKILGKTEETPARPGNEEVREVQPPIPPLNTEIVV